MGRKSKKIQLIEYLDPTKVQYILTVDPRDKVQAYVLMWIHKHYVMEAKTFKENLTSGRKKWERFYIHLTEEEKELLKQVFAEETERIIDTIGIEDKVTNFIEQCLMKYPFLRYAACVPAITTVYSLLPLVYRPPSDVIRGVFTPHGWYDKFIPHRQRNDPQDYSFPCLYNKYFYSTVTLPLRFRNVPWGKAIAENKVRQLVLERMVDSERVSNWFDRKYRQYLARNREKFGKERKTDALTAAYRDLLRVCLGNIYLIHAALAYRNRIVERFPLPKKLVEQPMDAVNWIDPYEVVDASLLSRCVKLLGLSLKEFREITWRWAVEVNSPK